VDRWGEKGQVLRSYWGKVLRWSTPRQAFRRTGKRIGIRSQQNNEQEEEDVHFLKKERQERDKKFESLPQEGGKSKKRKRSFEGKKTNQGRQKEKGEGSILQETGKEHVWINNTHRGEKAVVLGFQITIISEDVALKRKKGIKYRHLAGPGEGRVNIFTLITKTQTC